MIETETTSPHRNPVPWLTPMVVMWSTVIIVIALIVLGTWLNKRKAEFDTHHAREKIEAILRDAKFTPQQVEALTTESDAMLERAGVGIARRQTATRWFHRMEQSLACVAIRKKIGELDVIVEKHLGGSELDKQWTFARREAMRLIYVVDRADFDPETVLKRLDELLASGDRLGVAEVKKVAAEFQVLAAKAKAPQDPPPFDLYDSLHRGIIESTSDEPAAAETEKAVQP